MCSGWPADLNKRRGLLCLFVHALSSPNLSVNCFDLFVCFLLGNLRICCTKNDFWIAALSKHWLNLFCYSMSIFPVYSYACAIALDKPGLCSKLTLYLSEGIILCRHTKHPHEPTWMSLIKSLTLIKQRTLYPWSTGSEQLQFRKLFWSLSVLSSSLHALAPWPITTRAPGIGSGQSLFPSCSKPANRKRKIL